MAQTVLPQIADGGNWRTAVVLVNTTTSSATANLTFYQDTTGGATQPWAPPFLEVANTQNLSIPAAGTLFLHTPGTAAALAQGWGLVTGSAGVVPYAIYTYGNIAGRPDQDGTSQGVIAAPRILVPFDNTTGFATSLAIVNPTGVTENISINIQTDTGATSTASIPSLPANGQLAFVTAQQFPAAAGRRGLLEFSAGNGAIAIAPFRFNPTLALTSSPALLQTGAPIIGSTNSAGPAFSTIVANGSWSPAGAASALISISITPNADGTYQASLNSPGGNTILLAALQGTATNQGQVFTFNVISPAGPSTVPAVSLTFTLTQTQRQGFAGVGTFTGTLSVQYTSSGTTFTGSINGSYAETFLP